MSSTDERRFEVLRAIVTDYVATQEPIGSKALVDGQWLIDPSRTYIQDKPQILTSSGAQ